MPATVKSHILFDKYLELAEELYTEYNEEVIFGSFLSRVAEPGVAFSTGKAVRKQKVLEKKKSRDIRQVF